MKHLLLLIAILFTFNYAQSQTDYYRAYRTEIYRYNVYTEEWDLIQKNTDLNIEVAFTRNVITINAELATSYKLYPPYEEKIIGSNTTIARWKAYEITKSMDCTVDLVKYPNTNFTVLSVIYNDASPAVNLRYYLRYN